MTNTITLSKGQLTKKEAKNKIIISLMDERITKRDFDALWTIIDRMDDQETIEVWTLIEGGVFTIYLNETDYTIDRYAEKILLLYSVKSLPQEETIEEFLQKK